MTFSFYPCEQHVLLFETLLKQIKLLDMKKREFEDRDKSILLTNLQFLVFSNHKHSSGRTRNDGFPLCLFSTNEELLIDNIVEEIKPRVMEKIELQCRVLSILLSFFATFNVKISILRIK